MRIRMMRLKSRTSVLMRRQLRKIVWMMWMILWKKRIVWTMRMMSS